MQVSDIHPAIQQCLGTHRAFRKLGFPGKDIFVGLVNKDDVIVQLKTQGKTFTVMVAKSDMTNDEFIEHWERGCKMAQEGLSDDDMERMFLRSLPGMDGVKFVAAILDKGINLPVADEDAKRRAERN